MDPYPSGFENDDQLRSHFIRSLALRQLNIAQRSSDNKSPKSERQIPRTLIRFWHNINEVPADVSECLKSWNALLNQGFEFRMFSDHSAAAFIAERFGRRESAAFARCRHPAMRSDYFRMCFVLAEGGLYVDADDVLRDEGWKGMFRDGTLKIQALCYDVPTGGMVSASALRQDQWLNEGRIFYVNNNPIAAPPGHPVLKRALARATDILLGPEPAPEIQSTTGPGNLTVALAAHAHQLNLENIRPDFEILFEWERTAEPCWELNYRGDARNWRNMGPN